MFKNCNLYIGICLGFGILILGFATLVAGCGQQTSTTDTTTTTTGSITLSGSLNSGTISSLAIKPLAAISSYNVVAIDTRTNQTYYGTTDSSGNFSISLPAGISYEVSLVDSNSRYFGPVIMSGNTSSSEVITGIIPTTDTNLGTIVVDSSQSYAQPTTTPTAAAGAITASASSGVPLGAGNFGATTNNSITSTREGTADMDQDGVPDIFDADEDNDGYRNGVVSRASTSTMTSISNTVEAVFQTMNIWHEHGTAVSAPDEIFLRLHVIPISGHESEIASVHVEDVPASIKDVAIIWDASSLGSPLNYPVQNTLWSTVSYNLYKTTTLADEQWTVLVIPKALPQLGDTFKIRVTYTGGGTQDFFVSISFVLTDISTVTTYNGTTVTNAAGDKNNPITYSSNNLALVWEKPRDENGDLIEGLSHSIRYGGGATGGTVPTSVTETSVTDTVGVATLTAAINTATADTYYIAPTAETADGQRNGEEIWFEKQ